MIAAIPSSADPWLGLVAVGAVVLGRVAFNRGATSMVVTAAIALVGGMFLRAYLVENAPAMTANERNAASFFIALGVGALIVHIPSKRKA
jgi:hypothetical protein